MIISVLFLAVSSSLAPKAVDAQSDLSPPEFIVEEVRSFGSACPEGTLDVYSSSGRLMINTNTPELVIGPGISARYSRSNCLINLRIPANDTWQFSLNSFAFDRTLELDEGLRADVRLKTYVAYLYPDTTFTDTVFGPIFTEGTSENDLGIEQGFWSPCGRDFTYNISLAYSLKRVSRREHRGAEGFMQLGGGDLSSHRFGLSWRKCTTR
ncbi:MAG: DUF4360 domain-containing protein [Pseudobacteriovorax sp.]|nr:DUF4360 domain-containing protein [Pseudobacteriovorax sp.]